MLIEKWSNRRLSRSITCGQTDCFVHVVVDYFWFLSITSLMLLLAVAYPLCSSVSLPRAVSTVFASSWAVVSVYQLHFRSTMLLSHAVALSRAVVSLCISPAFVYSTLHPIMSSSLAQSPLFLLQFLQHVELFHAEQLKAVQWIKTQGHWFTEWHIRCRHG